MVMPIAEAVLQQLICTGLAENHEDSETAESPEDDSGTSGRPGKYIQNVFVAMPTPTLTIHRVHCTQSENYDVFRKQAVDQ